MKNSFRNAQHVENSVPFITFQTVQLSKKSTIYVWFLSVQRESILYVMDTISISVAKGPKFRPKTTIGAEKNCVGPGKSAAELLAN
jgi:hypothetical protein